MPTLEEELAALPFIEIPNLGVGPPWRIGGYDTVRLAALAAVAGWTAVGGSPTPPPEWRSFLNKVIRKAVWRELHKRKRHRIPLEQWENWHHPV